MDCLPKAPSSPKSPFPHFLEQHPTELRHSQVVHLSCLMSLLGAVIPQFGITGQMTSVCGAHTYFNKVGVKTLLQGFDHTGLIYISSITSQIFEFHLKAVSELKMSISYDKAEDARLQS